ncbi:hypothetical protein Ae168Ps1_2463 [Pseudonocardia sp. Ae168_Ps1]|nr:hypothetical protein Ae168Ps1_2463 [Pseudonocardia sp. Ae168_Ps1]OLL85811.1 hypothetical protein Ae263Ps1_2866c [Pseudonocardia sp. Ae263_Ps1]
MPEAWRGLNRFVHPRGGRSRTGRSEITAGGRSGVVARHAGAVARAHGGYPRGGRRNRPAVHRAAVPGSVADRG